MVECLKIFPKQTLNPPKPKCAHNTNTIANANTNTYANTNTNTNTNTNPRPHTNKHHWTSADS